MILNERKKQLSSIFISTDLQWGSIQRTLISYTQANQITLVPLLPRQAAEGYTQTDNLIPASKECTFCLRCQGMR